MAQDRSDLPGPLGVSVKLRAAVSRFGAEILPLMRGDGRPEDRLRSPAHQLVKEVGLILGEDNKRSREVVLDAQDSRPDLGVNTVSGRLGYIELKRHGKGVRTSELASDTARPRAMGEFA